MSRRRPRKRRGEGVFSLSFLDAVSCGFGAIVILLVLTKMGEPGAIVKAREDLDQRIAFLREELETVDSETERLERELALRRRQLAEESEKVAELEGELLRIEGEFQASTELAQTQDDLEGRLQTARQTLTEEMKRLLGEKFRRKKDDPTIGGIPVDSEYVIFVIDTSGSMQTATWSLVVQKMVQILDIYPKVRGMQIMNDMGTYMFPTYAKKWIPDTPGRRRLILSRLKTFNAFSNSSPVEGVSRAVLNFAAPDKKISIYVFGDEFSTDDSMQKVLDAVARVNTRDEDGNPRVRIHAVGFPVMFMDGNLEATGVRFAMLMRALCYENHGTFVGLNEVRP